MRQLGAKLQALPKTLQAEVARQGAPVCTELAQGAFDSGQTVYGDARPLGVDGGPLSLVKSGSVRGSLRFVATGTQIRCQYGPKHFKFLAGRFKIVPNNALPFRWRARLNEITKSVADREVSAAMNGVARKAG